MSTNQLGTPVTLPCGAVLKNRIFKSAMSDSLGDGCGNATDGQARLYERWAEGGAALMIVGEVQVTADCPEKPGNLVMHEQMDREALSTVTQRASIDGAHIWAQLGHAGGLSHAPISTPKGPSELAVNDFYCDGMSLEEVKALPGLYAQAALLAQQAGFTGVQIHAGHGFLLSQFLSPLFNRREDKYGGNSKQRSQVVLDIITAIRKAVGQAFPIGIKMNATDQLEGGLTPEDGLEFVRLLDQTSIDLIEISGGSYFPGAAASSDAGDTGSYFASFAKQARALTNKPLALIGGIKHHDQAITLLENATVDMIGLARAFAIEPNIANRWIDVSVANTEERAIDPSFPRFEQIVPGGITAWYSMRLTALAEDDEANFSPTLDQAIEAYEARDEMRLELWRDVFS